MHQSILYFYLAALSLAAANPLPYDPSEPLIDDADLNEFPLDPTNLFFVAQAAQDESGPSTNLDAPKIFCESGWLRTCCSFTKKNFNKRSGLYYHDCMSFPRDNEACDTESGINTTPRRPVTEPAGDLCCKDLPGVRQSNTGVLLCRENSPAVETVRDRGGRGGGDGNGNIRVETWGQ